MKKLTKRVVALVIACVLTVMSMPISVQAACQHPSQKTDGNGNLVYQPTGPASHHAVCAVCEMTYGNGELHSDNDNNQVCDACGDTVSCLHQNAGRWWDTDEKEHTLHCTCGYPVQPTVAHTDTVKNSDKSAGSDGLCDDCNVYVQLENGELVHKHTPTTQWFANNANTEHFNNCTDNECTRSFNMHNVIDADNDGKCDVCNHSMTSGSQGGSCKHDGFQWYGTDVEIHELHCGMCGESISGMEYHDDANGDTKCDVCGVGVVNNIHTHVWSTVWESNDTGHWHPCVDSACTTSLSSFAHEDADNDGSCDECGDTHTYRWCQNHWHNGDYAHSDDYHYTVCGDCWNAYGAGIAHFGADGYRVEADKHYPVCVDCWMSYGPGVAHADSDNDGCCDECEAYLGAVKVGGAYYKTFDEALDAANANGGTIVLLEDYVCSAKGDPQITNHVVIDSNGYQFSVSDERFCQLTVEAGASLTLTGNGKLIGGAYIIPILVKDGGSLIVEEDFHMDMLYTSDVENHGTVIFKGTGKTIYNVGDGVAHIYGSIGSVVNDGGTVHIYEGAVLAGKQFPVSNNLKGTVNVYGGTIDGSSGISASSGVINIQGGTINCSLQVALDNTNYANDPQIGSYEVSGGSFPNGLEVVTSNSISTKTTVADIIASDKQVIDADGEVISNLNVTAINEPVTVGSKKNYIVELGGVKYESIEDAYTAATSHGYILKLLKDIELDTELFNPYDSNGRGYSIIIDLNGYTLSNRNGGYVIWGNPTLYVTIQDTSVSQTGTVAGDIMVNGGLNIEGGTITGTVTTYNNSHSRETTTIKGGIFTSNGTDLSVLATGSYVLKGGTFKNGIAMTSNHSTYVDLASLLGYGYCYYLNGDPIVVAPGQTSITGGDVTIGKIPAAPSITKQPADVEVNLGERFRVSPEVHGNGLTYQWYYKDSYMKDFAVSSNKTSAYAYAMQSYMHNRQVYCVITDQYGQTVTTEIATITRPPVELKLLAQPEDAQATLGDRFSISPKVQGDGLTYQWYYKDSYMKSFGVSSNKTSAYAYSMQNYMNNRQVYCVITDQYGNQVTTKVATITLPPVELKILAQPEDAYAPVGQKFSISAQVQGDGLTYQWYYKEGSGKKFAASSNKTSAYAYSMQNYMNNRQVYCVITDKYGNQVTTDVVTLYLKK